MLLLAIQAGYGPDDLGTHLDVMRRRVHAGRVLKKPWGRGAENEKSDARRVLGETADPAIHRRIATLEREIHEDQQHASTCRRDVAEMRKLKAADQKRRKIGAWPGKGRPVFAPMRDVPKSDHVDGSQGTTDREINEVERLAVRAEQKVASAKAELDRLNKQLLEPITGFVW